MSNSSTISYFRNPFLRIIPLQQPLFNRLGNNNSQSRYTYYNPSQIKTAYNVVTPSVSTGQRNSVITVIVAYHYPNLQQDFNTFCTLFGLPQKTLQIVNLSNNANNTNSGWAQEECLDVQWSYAMNPTATIRVIEAASNSTNDLFAAIDYASNPANGATDIISMSWGGNEFRGQETFDTHFSNPNICYLASSGDSNRVSFPASSPNVLSCGGTSLKLNSDNTRHVESVWNSAGCGVSSHYTKPTYQQISTLSSTGPNRVTPDICAVADPNTGVIVVFGGKQYIFGGTSVATPILAGFVSIIIQKRINTGNKLPLTTITANGQSASLQNYLYKMDYDNSGNSVTYKNTFFDVITGSDVGTNSVTRYTIYNTSIGADVPTGLGVPNCEGLSNLLDTYN